MSNGIGSGRVNCPVTQGGYSLVELLVAAAIGLVVLGGGLVTYVSVVHNGELVRKQEEISKQMHAAISYMGDEIHRAGYWADAHTMSTTVNDNPFMAADTNLTVPTGNTCVLFSYDANKDGAITAIGTGSDDERYGFRLNNGVVQQRQSCSTFDCTSCAWEDITIGSSLQVTDLTFNESTQDVDADGAGTGTSLLRIRTITISMTGNASADSNITKTITRTVMVRNHYFIP